MHFSTTFSLAIVLLVPLVVSAVPLKRTADVSDSQVVQTADVLEKFETSYYQTLLGKFKGDDFTKAGFANGDAAIQQFETILSHESTHDTALTAVLTSLGVEPLKGCAFDFSKFLTDPKTAVASARVIEQIGVGAYAGAARLIKDSRILTAAATILTIEARHNSMLNMFNKGTIIPQPFDMAMNLNEVAAVVGPFISGCDLGITANTPLTITNTGTITTGTKLTFQSTALKSEKGMFCHILIGNGSDSIPISADNCVVPAGIDGPMLVFITDSNSPVSGDVITRQGQKVVAGPAVTYADSKDDLTSDLVRKTL